MAVSGTLPASWASRCSSISAASGRAKIACATASARPIGELATDSELTALRAVGGGGGPRLDPQGIRPRVLVANVTLVNDQLRMTFEYSEKLHERSTIAALADRMTEALRSIIAHCQDLMTSGYAP